jgi:hypothetical protein
MIHRSALVAALCFVTPAAAPASPVGADVAVATISPAEFLSARVRTALCDALGERDEAGDTRGHRLAAYASRPAGDPERHESTLLAARRIVAESPLELQAPDATAAWLLAAARQLERAGAEAVDTARRRELQLTAQLARFHGRRLIAAVRYNLFRRALSLPELYAAVRQEKEALAVWEELVRLAPDDDRGRAWRTDLSWLQENVRELEAQCCPPHPDAAGATVWRPLTD